MYHGVVQNPPVGCSVGCVSGYSVFMDDSIAVHASVCGRTSVHHPAPVLIIRCTSLSF